MDTLRLPWEVEASRKRAPVVPPPTLAQLRATWAGLALAWLDADPGTGLINVGAQTWEEVVQSVVMTPPAPASFGLGGGIGLLPSVQVSCPGGYAVGLSGAAGPVWEVGAVRVLSVVQYSRSGSGFDSLQSVWWAVGGDGVGHYPWASFMAGSYSYAGDLVLYSDRVGVDAATGMPAVLRTDYEGTNATHKFFVNGASQIAATAVDNVLPVGPPGALWLLIGQEVCAADVSLVAVFDASTFTAAQMDAFQAQVLLAVGP
jgi:hypothetical protein